ncbi:MAG: ABC-2 family transporter protein [Acidobacteriota bacterium]
MLTWPAAEKYLAFVRISLAHARRDRGELYGRAVFFTVILGVLSSLWRAAGESGLMAEAAPRTLLWYVAATEWILMSTPQLHLEIQETVRRGDVVYQLGRPISYVGAMFAEGVGMVAARAPVLGVVAFLCAFAYTGWIPPFRVLLLIAAFGLVATVLLTALDIVIGLTAFWLDDVAPVYWVWQKVLFVCGGLMMPIRLYPPVIQRFAAFTPFPSILAGPASFVLEGQAAAPGLLARDLAAWGVATAFVVGFLFRRASHALAVNGG